MVDTQNFFKKIEGVLKFERVLKKEEKPDWCNYDFIALFNQVLQGLEINYKFFYISKISEYPETKEKSKELVEKQRLLKTYLEQQGFGVVKAGRVRGYSQNGGKLIFKEKGVDVRIAVDMLAMSLLDKKVNNIILASSDSDLQPAIKEIRKRAGVSLIYLGFETGLNKGLTYTTNRTIVIRNFEVVACYKKQLKI